MRTKEQHKVVVIIGNGFDLDLGLPTSYKDYYQSSYCPKDYPAPLINYLNKRCSSNLDDFRWYDMENELFRYYQSISEPGALSDFITEGERQFLRSFQPYKYVYGIYEDKEALVQSLLDKGVIRVTDNILNRWDVPYQDDIQLSPNQRDRKALQLIKEGLCKYLRSIELPHDASSAIAFQVLALLDEEAGAGSMVNIYTFNYTPVQLNGKAPDYAQVHYLHGKCEDEKIIIGTRDDRNLNEEYDFLQKSFDPAFNPPALVEDLKVADEIVIFGHSIGENDRQYFKAFFKQQTDYSHPQRKEITIFTRDDASEIQIKRALQMMTDWNLSTLYGLNNIQIIKTGNVEVDQRLLYDFLVKHGKEVFRTREFIGQLLQKNTEL